MVKNFIPLDATRAELELRIRTQPLSASGFCLPCQISFNDRIGFVKHLANCRAKDVVAEPYGCVRCHTLISTAQAQDHLNHFDLFKHHKNHYTTTAGTAQPVKSVDFITLFQEADQKLKRSRVSISGKEAQRASQAWKRKQQEGSSVESTKFSCLHCKMALPSPATLQTHYLTTHAAAPIKQEPGERPSEGSSHPSHHLRVSSPLDQATYEPLNLTGAANPSPDEHRYCKRKITEVWSERPDKQARRSSPVPEHHYAQLNHDQQLPSESSSTEYYYLCVDCEQEKFADCSDSCNHLNHPRIPVGLDVSEHMERTGHTSFQPIQSFVSLVDPSPVFRLSNISYEPKWRNSVRRKWKTLIKDGKLL